MNGREGRERKTHGEALCGPVTVDDRERSALGFDADVAVVVVVSGGFRGRSLGFAIVFIALVPFLLPFLHNVVIDKGAPPSFPPPIPPPLDSAPPHRPVPNLIPRSALFPFPGDPPPVLDAADVEEREGVAVLFDEEDRGVVVVAVSRELTRDVGVVDGR